MSRPGWRDVPAMAVVGGVVKLAAMFAKLRSLRKAKPVKVFEHDWEDDAEYQVYFDLSVLCDDVRDIMFRAAGNPDAHVVAKA